MAIENLLAPYLYLRGCFEGAKGIIQIFDHYKLDAKLVLVGCIIYMIKLLPVQQ
jgi:hypothetical protein